MSATPHYIEIDAKSPQFADVGEKLYEMNWIGKPLPEWGAAYLLHYLPHKILGLQSEIIDKDREIENLKKELWQANNP